MAITVKAIYEYGILRPIEPISLVEGTRVEVTVMISTSETTGKTSEVNSFNSRMSEVITEFVTSLSAEKTPAEILAAIAAMPMEGSEEAFSAQDHDRVLYTQP